MPEPAQGLQTAERATWPVWVLPLTLLGVLGLTSVMEPLPSLGVWDGKRVLVLLAGALGLSLALLDADYRQQAGAWWCALPNPVAWAAVLALSLGVVSALTHPPVAYPLADVALLAWLVPAVLAVAHARQRAGPVFDRVLLGAIAVITLLVALIEGMGVLAGFSTGTPHSFAAMGMYFSHPRSYNHLQSWFIPVLAALPFVFGPRPRWWVIAIILLGIQWALLLLSGGRGSLLGLTTALLVMGALLWRQRPRWLLLQVCAVALGVVMLWAYSNQGQPESGATSGTAATGSSVVQEQSVGRLTAGSTSGRTRLWRVAFDAGLDNPWLGIGPSRYACIAPFGMGFSPHSLPLTLWSEWGIPATLLLAGVFGWLAWVALRTVWRRRTSPDAVLDQCLTAGLLAAAVHAGFSGVLNSPASQAAAILVCGWLLGRAPVPGRSCAVGRSLPWEAAVLALGLAVFALQQAHWMHTTYLPEAEEASLAPRFWHLGNVCAYESDSP